MLPSSDGSLRWRPNFPIDASRTLGSLRRGRHDPTYRISEDGSIWRAVLTSSGAVTYRVRQEKLDDLLIDAWGPGASEVMSGITRELGGRDHPEDFRPEHPALKNAIRRLPGLRVPHTGRLFEALVPAIIEQRVIGLDAQAAYSRLVRAYGAEPPGPAPAGMRLPPSPKVWASIPSWDWRKAGVDLQRSRTIVRAARYAEHLERTADNPQAAYALLSKLPGVGGWTAAQVGHRALGDADALPLGDYHLGRMTGLALIGRPLDDHEVEAFYERYRPHRYRVVRLIELTPKLAPRRGPRARRAGRMA